MDNDVVVTGMGVACHMGDSLSRILGKLREGSSEPFNRYEEAAALDARCQLIGRFPGDLSDAALGIDKSIGRFMGRAARLALRASRAALEQSQAPTSDLAVIFGSGSGDTDTHREIAAKLEQTKSMRKVSPSVVPKIMASTVSANLVNALQTKGPSCSVTAACAGGPWNIALAAMLLRAGACQRALVGGTESTDVHFHAGFDSMRAYNSADNERPEIASRPYSADRQGFIFSEGAGALILETRKSAAERGATVLGILKGFGMSSDGEGEMVAPAADGAFRAMQMALQQANLKPEQIDYVNTHGTSTPVGDIGEVQAIRRIMDGRRVPYSSTKGYTGHTVSAAGAIEAIFTIAMLREGWIAPCVNISELDPKLADYPPIQKSQNANLRFALSNSFGFGGTNVSLVFERP
ncbi:MAG TPA: beta-ketoacyl-[acyl-carrier-protein] synthase family protein [Polyangiales bacterium]|jgi:3-oxoacyl-[acyl-carrier-protein] synthase-1|nr:beta-ketoacyl-[acyl-carrier-protein] synthase family protein [Polyangiales bacterium]